MDLEIHRLPGETFERKLGRTPPDQNARIVRASMGSYLNWLNSRQLSLIPQAQWRPIGGPAVFDESWVNDQLRYGACVGASDAMAFAKVRVLRGLARVDFSWAYVYDQINGGRDNGACITDAARVDEAGVPPYGDYSRVPQFDRSDQPASRTRFRLPGWLTWTHWLEGCDILQRGGVVQYPVQVGQRYNQFTGDWCCGVDRGPGNHSVHADGMAQLKTGEWVWTHMGSWGVSWANRGRAYHTQAHVEGCAVEDDAYGLIFVSDDPQEAAA